MNQAAEMVNEVEVTGMKKETFMQRVWSKMGKEEKGFTLIELLAVLVIIAIIAVIAIPLIGNIINKSRDNADLDTASQVYNAARLYVIGENNGDFKTVTSGESGTAGVVTLGVLQENSYIDNGLVLPSTKVELNGSNTKVTFNTTTGALEKVDLNDESFTAAEVLSATKDAD